ncbi:hypothetical protein KVT40_004600 [Elsinoe batatas]|uniref:Actin-like ATPase domain-containing protein n=1 Tax=Elsinoe batatas TaxID=2601811 RepID=A0A8K0L110_9PEZI|nr:hypothetical protein KVT40_004600 [Elsinoe batatas]
MPRKRSHIEMKDGIEDPDRIVVAHDIGTTFSGVAIHYAVHGADINKTHVITKWPSASGITTEKEPTQFNYHADGTLNKVGYSIPPDQDRIRCIKLMIENSQPMPEFTSRENIEAQLAAAGKTPVEALADYLREQDKTVRVQLVDRFQKHVVGRTKIEHVFTVPAIWSDVVKDATLQAVKLAGLGDDIQMVSEPEAAAVYALTAMGVHELKVGDAWIVCDAGGGTVDLTTYVVESLSPLQLRELVAGAGAMCGGTFLDFRFESLVRRRMGNEAFEAMKKRRGCWSNALVHFDTFVKRSFLPTDDITDADTEEFYIPFHGVADNLRAGIEDGYLTLRSAEVLEIFAPILKRIMRLIEEQRKASAGQGKIPKGVLVVGGFGQSQYLFQSIRDHFASEAAVDARFETVVQTTTPAKRRAAGYQGLVVVSAPNPWSAVARGGILLGLTRGGIVLSRMARRHYGIVCRSSYDYRKHLRQRKYKDELDGAWMVDNQMEWFIRMNDKIETGKAVLHDFYRTETMIPQYITVTLLFCDAIDAPTRLQDGDTRILTLCRLTVDTKKIPRSKWVLKTSPVTGRAYHQLSYQIGMAIESGSIKFDVRVKGKVCGSVDAKYE